jgi:hypothetical protein
VRKKLAQIKLARRARLKRARLKNRLLERERRESPGVPGSGEQLMDGVQIISKGEQKV